MRNRQKKCSWKTFKPGSLSYVSQHLKLTPHTNKIWRESQTYCIFTHEDIDYDLNSSWKPFVNEYVKDKQVNKFFCTLCSCYNHLHCKKCIKCFVTSTASLWVVQQVMILMGINIYFFINGSQIYTLINFQGETLLALEEWIPVQNLKDILSRCEKCDKHKMPVIYDTLWFYWSHDSWDLTNLIALTGTCRDNRAGPG